MGSKFPPLPSPFLLPFIPSIRPLCDLSSYSLPLPPPSPVEGSRNCLPKSPAYIPKCFPHFSNYLGKPVPILNVARICTSGGRKTSLSFFFFSGGSSGNKCAPPSSSAFTLGRLLRRGKFLLLHCSSSLPPLGRPRPDCLYRQKEKESPFSHFSLSLSPRQLMCVSPAWLSSTKLRPHPRWE